MSFTSDPGGWQNPFAINTDEKKKVEVKVSIKFMAYGVVVKGKVKKVLSFSSATENGNFQLKKAHWDEPIFSRCLLPFSV
jgi:hypothetical protein